MLIEFIGWGGGGVKISRRNILTVHGDGDLFLIIASLGLHLSSACVLTVVSARYVPDP